MKMKKIIAIATTATIALMTAGPILGDTAADLQAQIDALLAQIATLQTQLGTLTGTPAGVPAACAGITFTRNLKQGMSGNDVKCLQAICNQSVDTQLAASGVGSAGSETIYFGPLTKGGVVKYQNKYAAAILTPLGLTAGTGFFGPSTMAKVNAVLAGGVTPTVCTTNADCTAGQVCTAGACVTTTPGACDGGEGSYTTVLSTTPVSRTVNAGVGIEAWAVDIKAVNSDINIGRLDFQAAVTAGGIAENPGNFIKTIKVYDTSVSDANLVRTYASPVFTQDSAAVWYTQLTGLGFVIPKDTTKKLLVAIDTTTTIDLNRTVTVRAYGASGIRGRDCLGIDSYQTMATTRVLTIQQPGVAVVTITAATDQPISSSIMADATNGVQTNETLLSLNAKATAGDATLMRLEVTYASAASAVVLPSVLYLYDGDTLVGSTTPADVSVAVFENFTLPLSQNVSKNLKIKANWAAATAFESGGAAFTVVAPASNATTMLGGVYQRANGQQVGVVNAGVITSNLQFIAESGLYLTFVQGTANYTPEGTVVGVGTAAGTIVFKVKPFGGTLQEPAYASLATSAAALIVSSGMLARIEGFWLASGNDAIYASAAQIVVSRAPLQCSPSIQDIADGSEATVTAKITVHTAGELGAFAGNVRFKLEDICYDVGGTLNCIGSGGYGDGVAGFGMGGGNITDSWITNTVYMTP